MFSHEEYKCLPHIFFYEMKWGGGPCLKHFQVRKAINITFCRLGQI